MRMQTAGRALGRLAATAVVFLAGGLATGVAGPGQGLAQAAPASSTAASGRYTLTNVNSGKCLDVVYGGKDDFAPVIQYRCYGGPVQQWVLTYVSADVYTLANVNSEKCLDVTYGGKDDFVSSIQYHCYGGPVQQWRLTNVIPGVFTLTNVNSGKCLDVTYGGKDDFVPVIQYRCYGGPVQQWRLTYLGG
jgi:hypothetical protein